MAHPNAELAQRLYDAFGSGDLESVAGLLSDDVLWHMPGNNQLAGDWEGQDDVRAHLARIAELTGGTYSLQVRDILTSDDRAAVVYRATGHRGDRMLDLDQVLLLDIQDGKVQEARIVPEDQYAFDAFWA